jgi:hypothetical protein
LTRRPVRRWCSGQVARRGRRRTVTAAGKGGREFLATLELRAAPRRRLDSLLALIDDFDREID